MAFEQSEWVNFLTVARLSLRTSVLRSGNNKYPENFLKHENVVSDNLTGAYIYFVHVCDRQNEYCAVRVCIKRKIFAM